MKKIFTCSIYLFALVFNAFTKSIIDQFEFSNNVPLMVEVEYTNKENIILIKNREYCLSMEFSSNDNCRLTVSNNKYNAIFFAHLKKDAIDSLNTFYIDKESLCILICYNIMGVTGLSANISSGLLIKLNEEIDVVELSSFGDLRKNFIDINNDGSFEFVCIDLFYGEVNRYLVPNIFSLTHKVENITDKSKLFSVCIDELHSRSLYPKDYTLIKEPKIMKNKILYH